jgi:hypothetical protein
MRRMAAARVALLAQLCAGCAAGDGDPFGTVQAQLDAQLGSPTEPANGWRRLASDFEVRVSHAELHVDALELIDVEGTVDASTDPNPGGGACHGEHCHTEDGALVSVDEAPAASSGPTTVALLTLPAVDLLSSSPATFDCGGPCGLPESHISAMRLTVHELNLQGEVRDTRTPARLSTIHSFSLELHLEEPLEDGTQPGVLRLPLDLEVDDELPPHIELTVVMRLDAGLFDAVAFDELAMLEDGTLDLVSEAAHEQSELVAERFAATALGASGVRRE